MLLTGLIGQEGKMKTANLINLIFQDIGKKVSIIDSKDLLKMDPAKLKAYLKQLSQNKTDVLILKINILDISREIFNKLHFDIIIYTDKADNLNKLDGDECDDLIKKTFSFLDEKGIAIVNVDDTELIKLLHGMKHYIITYGFNSKASITASSTGDAFLNENFMCCLQRTLYSKNGILIEPQEYLIRIESDEIDAYNVLAAATFAIINDVDLNLINFL